MTTRFESIAKANDWYTGVFLVAANIVAGRHYRYDHDTQQFKYFHDLRREWFDREMSRAVFHPAVRSLMCIYKPDDWQQLLLEWPHKSSTDANRLAYTRDERDGMRDRQMVTTIGKYLRRHFSHAPDDMIRDIVAEHTYGGAIDIVNTVEQMVFAVENGPRSCMSKSMRIRCDDGERRHPYHVYDPSLGWAMAVRRDSAGEILGRCLVWIDPDGGDDDGTKMFVRSYKRERDEFLQSGADEAIETYLRGNGYVKLREWKDGTPLMKYPVGDDRYLMPYIDGSTQRVDEDTFTIDSDGDIEADDTSGTGIVGGQYTCECCGARCRHEEDMTSVGRYGDMLVCQSCIDSACTYVTGARGDDYYVPNDDAVECDGEYYDSNYLSDNSIVRLEDGEYTHIDNAVWIESANEYYHGDDSRICYDEDAGEYALKEDCWQCAESGDWYNDGVDYVEVDGKTYHPDHAPEVEAADDDTNTNTN